MKVKAAKVLPTTIRIWDFDVSLTMGSGTEEIMNLRENCMNHKQKTKWYPKGIEKELDSIKWLSRHPDCGKYINKSKQECFCRTKKWCRTLFYSGYWNYQANLHQNSFVFKLAGSSNETKKWYQDIQLTKGIRSAISDANDYTKL